jgi:HlyD family secretion protein
MVEVGDAVQPGRVLIEVALDGPTEVVAFPSEENLPLLREGARAIVSADAFPSDSIPARVRSVAPVVDPSQGTVEVRLSLDDPPAYLRPDMTLSVSIEGGVREGAHVLPLEAVRGLGAGAPWVAVVRDGRLERRAVLLGLRGAEFIEILGGVEPGEAIAADPEIPEPGARVRVAS